jgi:hypothetical protein
MKTGWPIATILLLSFLLGFPFSQYAQNAPPQDDNSQHAKHSLGVNFLRAINTAEMAYRDKHGSFASWFTLQASVNFALKGAAGQESQSRFVVAGDPQVSPDPPGWNLRFNLTADGQGYDVLLEDTNDKEHGYALLTDERGLIRECKAL